MSPPERVCDTEATMLHELCVVQNPDYGNKMALEKQLERREKLEKEIYYANKEYIADGPFQDITDLQSKLEKLKCAFMQNDPDCKGEMDYTTLHVMAQDLGITRTLMELKQQVQEITGNIGNSIPYKDCAMAMLGRRSTMCQRIMQYNVQGGEVGKRVCLLDDAAPHYITRTEVTLSSALLSPVAVFSPPPPPSPADMGAEAQIYPAA
ncbi:allograft inflammatory factor 1-like [Ascaphus truei]|uniref:allograft inflammatory factor 1-like n=1 Tax=Ascaphus truei TaxID=8439 RepID=UPI003F5949AB